VRTRIPYLDVAAEIEVAVAAFEQYPDRARGAGIAIVPAIGFYGGLGDLLATAAMGDWRAADEISIAYALSSWKPTLGTRATTEVSNQRRGGRRIAFANHRLELRTDGAPIVDWAFPAPVGTQAVVAEFTTVDTVTIAHHLRTAEIRTYMTVAPLRDLSDPDLSPPAAIDESGRSSQTFLVEVVARLAGKERRALASGRDIYAVTARLWWKRPNASSAVGASSLVSSLPARPSTHETSCDPCPRNISHWRLTDGTASGAGSRVLCRSDSHDRAMVRHEQRVRMSERRLHFLTYMVSRRE
jgi:hypothetical protein